MHIDKDKVKYLYLKGYNAKQISNIMGCNVDGIRKCIQRNYPHYKLRHETAVEQRKDALRAVNYEANKYISDRSFILKNRSIYKTKENGDIVINRKVAPIVTWDTPKSLINENKYL